jgi:uncharacterized BrkB/YihY/UPF0761 family membrane protein
VIIRYLRVFWERAYRENITGMAAMVAYNLALALFRSPCSSSSSSAR